MTERIFSKGFRFFHVRALTSHRATLLDVYQLASKTRLYRGTNASRANLHNLIRLESPLDLFSLFSVIPLPPPISRPFPASRASKLTQSRETRLLYTAIEVKAPPSGVSYLWSPHDSRSTSDPKLGTPWGKILNSNRDERFMKRGVAWRPRARGRFVFPWWAAESILVYVTTKPPARRDVTFDDHIDFRSRQPHSTLESARRCRLRTRRLKRSYSAAASCFIFLRDSKSKYYLRFKFLIN